MRYLEEGIVQENQHFESCLRKGNGYSGKNVIQKLRRSCPTTSSKLLTGKHSQSVVGEWIVGDKKNKKHKKESLCLDSGPRKKEWNAEGTDFEDDEEA